MLLQSTTFGAPDTFTDQDMEANNPTDFNLDGSVDVSDIIVFVEYLLENGRLDSDNPTLQAVSAVLTKKGHLSNFFLPSILLSS